MDAVAPEPLVGLIWSVGESSKCSIGFSAILEVNADTVAPQTGRPGEGDRRILSYLQGPPSFFLERGHNGPRASTQPIEVG